MLIQTNNAGNKNKSFEKLIELSNRLEIGFGYPLDIEWAKSDSEYYILQCRPITNLKPPDRIKGRTYSRVQAEQFFSGPVSPLFYSIFKKLYTTNYLQETISELKINLELDDDGVAQRGLLIRHLVLPAMAADSCAALDFIVQEVSLDAYISLMAQYHPCYRAFEHSVLKHRLKRAEYQVVVQHAQSLGLEHCYIQSLISSGDFLPDFQRENPFDQG